jgi:Flp pilus assembly protein TadG
MTALMLVPMIVISGGAIDLIAHERLRTVLQDGLDRGVLAAASLTQTRPARETIESFLKTAVTNGSYSLNVKADEHSNAKRVEASATAVTKTAFLHLIGIDELLVQASSAAEEKRKNIEISLLLDVSGSMRFNASGSYSGPSGAMRINFLKPAAKSFMDMVLADGAEKYTSVSIVPYAGQVSVGPVLFDALSSNRRQHDRSSCFQFDRSDFTLGVPNFANLAQTQHFTQSNHHDALKKAGEAQITEPWWCPDDPHDPRPGTTPDFVKGEGKDTDRTRISFLSNDREYLKRQIDNYKLYDGTGTPIALKWGLLLLDPAIQPLLRKAASYRALSEELDIDPRFSGRPASFSDPDTMKFIVLMTDGAISSQRIPNDASKPVQYYNNGSLNTDLYSVGDAERFAASLCSAAKQKNIVVFTIGFDVNDTAAKQMSNCASGPERFYRVNALDIQDAFKSIATAIQKIKLVG